MKENARSFISDLLMVLVQDACDGVSLSIGRSWPVVRANRGEKPRQIAHPQLVKPPHGIDDVPLDFAAVSRSAALSGYWFSANIRQGAREAPEVVARSAPVARAAAARDAQKSRREQVEGSLKDLDAKRAKAKSLPLAARISQAGLNWSKRKFYIISVMLGVGGFLLVIFIDGGLLAAFGMAFACGFGLPLWGPQIPQEAPGSEAFIDRSRRRRHDRTWHQGGPAAARQSQA